MWNVRYSDLTEEYLGWCWLHEVLSVSELLTGSAERYQEGNDDTLELACSLRVGWNINPFDRICLGD